MFEIFYHIFDFFQNKIRKKFSIIPKKEAVYE